MTTTEAPPDRTPLQGPDADLVERKTMLQQVALFAFITVPFLAVLAAIPVLWGRGLGWHDALIAVGMYFITGHGITVGFHRHFTHRAFQAKRGLRIALAVAGSMAIQGPILRWVADHRKHHRFSDRDGDPHSPWRFGSSLGGLAKGFFWAHIGWLFDVEHTSTRRYASELLEDRAIVVVSKTFGVWVVASMALPPLVGGLWAWSWGGAATAFFWGSLVRVALLHHVTFAINSVCHLTGRQPYKTRDRSGNVWWLAVPSMGEAWHNFHHAEPASARHGVRPLEIDTSAWVIRLLERLRWVSDVRWPDAAVVARRRNPSRPPVSAMP